ncbi:sulfurtransferase-like selenium metabolism protein YedF [Candidatus Riflebacteria bacterium]
MKKTIVINSEFMGSGDEDLGRQLMGSFLRKLSLEESKPEKIIFYNSGVKLLAIGSPVLDGISLLTEAGIEIMACGTCVHFYQLEDRIERGLIGDMQRIISTLMNSDKVITI